jgi:hypothetical protein
MTAAALAAMAAAVLLAGLPHASGPESVSAAEVLDRALATYSSARTWQADLHLKWYDKDVWTKYHTYATRRAHLVWAADGSRHETFFPVMAAGHLLLDETLMETYDATTDKSAGFYDEDGARSWEVSENLPLGSPDTGTVPLIDFATVCRALAASETLRLDETVVDGRLAWTVTCTKGELIGLPPSSGDWPVYRVTVDKQTWLMLGLDQIDSGRLTLSARYRDVRVNAPLPDDVFAAEVPPGVPVERTDGGFHRVTLDDAAATPCVRPLVPGVTPDRYELTCVSVAAHALTVNEAASGRDVLELQYTRGFDTLTVSTRAIDGRDYTVDVDPCEEFDQAWSKRARTEAPIESGAFVGITARVLVATTTSVPHLWAVKDGVLLTIAGVASAEELLVVAESLQVYPGASPAAE